MPRQSRSAGRRDPRSEKAGEIAVAARLRTLLAGSTIVEAHREDDLVQDPISRGYQVLGAVLDAVDAVRRVVPTNSGR